MRAYYYRDSAESISSSATSDRTVKDEDVEDKVEDKYRQIRNRLIIYGGGMFGGGAIVGFLLTLIVFLSTSKNCGDVPIASDALHVKNEIVNSIYDCYDDRVVNDKFYCSLNDETQRQCNEKKFNRSEEQPTRIWRKNKMSIDTEDILLHINDYSYPTFGPPIIKGESLSLIDIRLRLSRIVCHVKNLLVVLSV